MSTYLKMLKTCAFCPNPCRSALPREQGATKESKLPSTQSLLTLYLIENRVSDPSLRETLSDRSAVRTCQKRCVYGFDVDGAIAEALETLPDAATPQDVTP